MLHEGILLDDIGLADELLHELLLVGPGHQVNLVLLQHLDDHVHGHLRIALLVCRQPQPRLGSHVRRVLGAQVDELGRRPLGRLPRQPTGPLEGRLEESAQRALGQHVVRVFDVRTPIDDEVRVGLGELQQRVERHGRLRLEVRAPVRHGHGVHGARGGVLLPPTDAGSQAE
eukprot:6939782-Prymnesium_polylepis.1